ncbi:hypothetical protein P4N68_12980 [Corynebacterium felinum]|nr:hypothetical protein [Corynebacterium felinum]MDF5821982.1 hypothetical protein [Corynebacterium felinum]
MYPQLIRARADDSRVCAWLIVASMLVDVVTHVCRACSAEKWLGLYAGKIS